MMREIERLKTFETDEWKNQKKTVDIKRLAIVGLYYSGERDIVHYAFCKIKLYDWKTNDDPVSDHYYYSPRCPLFGHGGDSRNVPIGNSSSLTYILSSVTINDRNNCDGYDEVDRLIE
ncbi:death-associated inhibitor of apoptosis 1-like [Contarinia nasturtii]|uniref:death-associated inhibitor of apoptosis 1-like n=1 Tax=Contarinia nasturtii TaxID=265458 RepID=UPI0012D487D1|nr:death-associated inhibitor of apoptosis 1-like [Contarinia nasturtii]